MEKIKHFEEIEKKLILMEKKLPKDKKNNKSNKNKK
jgi:hypothetical protein